MKRVFDMKIKTFYLVSKGLLFDLKRKIAKIY